MSDERKINDTYFIRKITKKGSYQTEDDSLGFGSFGEVFVAYDKNQPTIRFL